MRKKATPVTAGTVILNSTPFAYCLKSSLIGERCDCCLKILPDLRRCTGCLVVSYCGRSCQKQAWNEQGHKGECQNFVKVKPNTPSDSVRLIARIILKLQKGGDVIGEAVTPTVSRKFKDLMSHYKEIQEDKKRMEHFSTIYACLQEFLSGYILPNSAELLSIYGRVCVNSFSIVNGEMQAIGTGVYLGPSILDHSCEPNAVVTFDGFHLRCTLTEDLPFLDWNSIRISYIDMMNCKEDRLKELKERYYFDCDCPRCSGKKDVDLYHYAAKCPNCSGAVIRIKKNENFPPCACGSEINFAQQFWQISDYSEQQLSMMQQTNYLDVCNICIRKQDNMFHNLCLVRTKTLDAAFEAAIDMQLWDVAFEYGQPLIACYEFWYGKNHPLTGILLLKLFKIVLLTATTETDSIALKYYQQAIKILELTHGKSSSFYCQEVKPLIQQLR